MKTTNEANPKPKMNKRPIGITKILAQMAAGAIGMESVNAMLRRNELLTNGYRNPMPSNMYNQRQRRKLARQTGVFN